MLPFACTDSSNSYQLNQLCLSESRKDRSESLSPQDVQKFTAFPKFANSWQFYGFILAFKSHCISRLCLRYDHCLKPEIHTLLSPHLLYPTFLPSPTLLPPQPSKNTNCGLTSRGTNTSEGNCQNTFWPFHPQGVLLTTDCTESQRCFFFLASCQCKLLFFLFSPATTLQVKNSTFVSISHLDLFFASSDCW